jgi:hypothetical protein
MKYLVVLFMVSLFATQGAHGSGYLTPYGTGVTIIKYHVHGEGGITLWVSGLSNPDGCGGTSLAYITHTLPGYKTMVAAAMMAHALGKKIGLYGSGCSGLPFWGAQTTYPDVIDVWVTD